MSANLDLVRSIFADWERGDFRRSDWAHPEIEFTFAVGPSPGTWRGVTGMWEGVRDWMNAWEHYRITAEEFRELDDERVLVLGHMSGRAKSSGLELGQLQAHGADLFYICEGKVTRLVAYADREHAFADLGLAPEADVAGPD